MEYTEDIAFDALIRTQFIKSNLSPNSLPERYSPCEDNLIQICHEFTEINGIKLQESIDPNIICPKRAALLPPLLSEQINAVTQGDSSRKTTRLPTKLSLNNSEESTKLTYWAKCDGIVHASPEDVIAHLFDTESSHSAIRHIKRNGDDNTRYPYGIIQRVNPHHHLVYSCQRMNFPLNPRDFYSRKLWKRLSPDCYIFIEVPLGITEGNPDFSDLNENNGIPEEFLGASTLNRVTHASKVLVTIIDRLEYSQSAVNCFASYDLKATMPLKIVSNYLVVLLDDIVLDTRQYFQRDAEIDAMYRNNFIDLMSEVEPLALKEKEIIEEAISSSGLPRFSFKYVDSKSTNATLNHSNEKENGYLNPDKSSFNLQQQREQTILSTSISRPTNLGSTIRWSRIQANDDSYSTMKKYTAIHKSGNNQLLESIKVVGLIHARKEEVLAYLWNVNSNAKLKHHQKYQSHQGNTVRSLKGLVELNNDGARIPCRAVVFTEQLKVGGYSNVLVASKRVWCEIIMPNSKSEYNLDDADNRAYVLAVEPFNISEGENQIKRNSSGRKKISKASQKRVMDVSNLDTDPDFKHTHFEREGHVLREIGGNSMHSSRLSSDSNSIGLAVQKKGRSIFSPTSSAGAGEVSKKMRNVNLRGIYVLRAITENICELSIVNSFELKGNLVADNLSPGLSQKLSMNLVTSYFNDPKNNFERNGYLVDRDLRENFVSRIPFMTPADAHIDRLAHVKHLEKQIIWNKETRVNTLVTASLSKDLQWLCNVSTIDTSAENVLAWIWDFCGHERLSNTKDLQKNRKEVLKKRTSTEQIVYSVKNENKFLARHYFSSNTWIKDNEEEQLVYVWTPITDVRRLLEELPGSIEGEDGFKKGGKICGKTTGYVILKNVVSELGHESKDTCIVKWVQNVDTYVHHQEIGWNMKLLNRFFYRNFNRAKNLDVVSNLCTSFSRSDEIDSIHRQKFLEVLREKAQNYTKEEDFNMELAKNDVTFVNKARFRPLVSPDPNVSMEVAKIEGEKVGVSKSETIIDASIEEVSAYLFLVMSRGEQYYGFEKAPNRVLKREIIKINEHCQIYHFVVVVGQLFQPREFLVQMNWKKVGSAEILLSATNVDTWEGIELSDHLYVKGFLNSLFHLESVKKATQETESQVPFPQTRVGYSLRIDLCGNIPHFAYSAIEIHFLSILCRLRTVFRRDFEYDHHKRMVLLGRMAKEDNALYLESELRDVEEGKRVRTLFKMKNIKKSTVETENPVILGHQAMINGENWCRLSTTVRSSADESFAFLWNINSRALTSDRELERCLIERDDLQDEDRGDHSQVVQIIELTNSSSRIKRETLRRMVYEVSIGQRSNSIMKSTILRKSKGMQESKVDGKAGLDKEGKVHASNVPEVTGRADQIVSQDRKGPSAAAKKISFQRKRYLLTCFPASSTSHMKGRKTNNSGSTLLSAWWSHRKSQGTYSNKSTSNVSKRGVDDGASSMSGTKMNRFSRMSSVSSNRILGWQSRIAPQTSLGARKTFLDEKSKAIIDIVEVAKDEVKVDVLFNLPYLATNKNLKTIISDRHEFRMVERIQESFLCKRELKDLDEIDGKQLGLMLMGNKMRILMNERGKNSAAIKELAVEFLNRFTSMQQMKKKYSFFENMLITTLQGERKHEWIATNSRKDKLSLLLPNDGITLGDSFNSFLSISANEEGAINAWEDANVSMIQLRGECPWILPFFRVVGKKIRYRITLMKYVIALTTMLSSILDISTDCYTIAYYFSIGNEAEAEMMIFFIALGLTLQCIVAYLAHRKNKLIMLREMLYTVTLTKPFTNWFKVLTAPDHMDGHETMPPISELMMYQCAEIVAESIPCTLIQVQAVLNTQEFDFVLILSLLISGIVTSFNISYMTYIKDTNPEDRRTGKIFYGFVPLTGWPHIFSQVCMLFLSFAQLLGKGVIISLLSYMGGPKIVWMYLSSWLSFFFLFKVVRGDFLYFPPLENPLHYMVSTLMRSVTFLIADFTGMIHLRHPYEVGGFMFTSILALNQVSLHLIIYLRFNFAWTDKPSESVFSLEHYRYIAFGLSSLFVGSYSGLIYFCVPKYRTTFYALTTSSQFQKRRFWSGTNETKYKILTTTHEVTWRSFGDEIMTWLENVWSDLLTNRPEWFTEASMANIPPHMIPGDNSLEEKLNRAEHDSLEKMSRRKSIFEGLGLDTAEDIRRRKESQIIQAKLSLNTNLVIIRKEDRGQGDDEAENRPKVLANRRNSMVGMTAGA